MNEEVQHLSRRLEISLMEYEFGGVDETARLLEAGFELDKPIERRCDGKYRVVFIQNPNAETRREVIIRKVKSHIPLDSDEQAWLNKYATSDKVLNGILKDINNGTY